MLIFTFTWTYIWAGLFSNLFSLTPQPSPDVSGLGANRAPPPVHRSHRRVGSAPRGTDMKGPVEVVLLFVSIWVFNLLLEGPLSREGAAHLEVLHSI